MGKLIVSEFVSLDGVVENPAWTAPYWSDQIGEYKYAELFASDALLLGRVTYQGFAEAWPDRSDEQGYADRMNNLPKVVASTTLADVAWSNSSLITGDVAQAIARLKQESNQTYLVFGSGTLVQTLIEHDLVDEYRLLVYPVVLGRGQRLFGDGCKTNLKLTETKSFDSGVVALHYQADRQAARS